MSAYDIAKQAGFVDARIGKRDPWYSSKAASGMQQQGYYEGWQAGKNSKQAA